MPSVLRSREEAVPKNRNRQAENDLQNKDEMKDELASKSVKAVAEVKESIEAEFNRTLDINYQEAATEAINIVTHNLPTKEIEQRLRQDLEKQQRDETL